MAEKFVRFAVVGGGMGKAHIKGIESIDEARLTAFCDINEEIARSISAEHGLNKYYTDYYEMLRDGGFDCIVLCTPDQIHREQCIAALEAGYHVLCEKPLALNMEDCRAIYEAARVAKGKFMVGQICRKTPGFIKAKELIEDGMIGDIFFIESEYAHDYAHMPANSWRWDPVNLRPAITGGGCHAVDLIRWLVGDPVEIMSYSNHKVLTDIPVDDCSISIMKFADGVIGKVFCSIGCKRNYTMRTLIYGTKGTIICDNRSPEISLFQTGNKDDHGHEIYEPKMYPVDINHHNATGEIQDMCDVILGDLEVVINAAEGANTVAVCDAIVKSSATGKPVTPEYIR